MEKITCEAKNQGNFNLNEKKQLKWHRYWSYLKRILSQYHKNALTSDYEHICNKQKKLLENKYKKEPSGDFRTVKYNDQNLKSSLYGLNGRTEMTE